jgi:ParB-like chromosome segregation protein Spo0J
MLFLQLSTIKIAPNRQRREFDPQTLQELADSIDKHGLLQPIIVREIEGDLQLVAGERRLRAIRDHLLPLGGKVRYAGRVLDDGTVPAVPLGELDQLAAEEAELEENIRREDLTWQERAAAVARLADLRRRQAEAAGRTAPSVAELSIEVRGSAKGINQESTRRELILAKHLGNPTIAAAKSADEAWKALKLEEEARRNAELAATVGLTFTADLHEIRNEDALSWLKACAAERFDVILTDPPYGIGADRFGDSGGAAAAHGYADTPEVYSRILTVAFTELYRITKPQAHLYWFCDVDTFLHTREMFEAGGWWVHRTPLIWYKPSGQRVPWPEHGPRRSHELILYAVKGERPTTGIYSDVLPYAPDGNLGHKAQKPVALFADMLRRSVHAGDAVCDPFCGTGPIIPAAHELKCRATAIEIDPSAYGIAVQRVKALKEIS